jgi:hypothetical protein
MNDSWTLDKTNLQDSNENNLPENGSYSLPKHNV